MIIQELLQHIRAGNNPCTDSRQAKPGDIFFALQGDHFDGNRFAAHALAAGCSLAVIDDPDYEVSDRCLVVEDVLDTLQSLSLAYRQQFDFPVIGITGSNGKTTTKELLHAVLLKSYTTIASKGNLNNHIGVPLTLLSFDKQMEMAIVEMGANHRGEIANLSKIAQPTHGLITNIGKAHLEGFGSIEQVAAAKAELYHYLADHQGTFFLNNDNPWLADLNRDINTISYGQATDNHLTGQMNQSFPFVHMTFMVNKDFGYARAGNSGSIKSKLTGAYNFENIMAALTTGLFFGVPTGHIIEAIESYVPVNHRSQVVQTDHNTVIMDAYNANPTSMIAALENLSQFRDQKKAVLLGDMLELGDYATEEHQKVVEKVNQENVDLRIFVGSHFLSLLDDKEDERTQVFTHVDEAAKWLSDHPLKGYYILVKGSRTIRMEETLAYL